jgi:hypothetical protein
MSISQKNIKILFHKKKARITLLQKPDDKWCAPKKGQKSDVRSHP